MLVSVREPHAPKGRAHWMANAFYLPGLSLDDYGLQAVIAIQMHVGGTQILMYWAVLKVDDLPDQIALMMIELTVQHPDDAFPYGLPTCPPPSVPESDRRNEFGAGGVPRRITLRSNSSRVSPVMKR